MVIQKMLRALGNLVEYMVINSIIIEEFADLLDIEELKKQVKK